jgi:DNA-directed RNA polymerase subunit beta
MLTIKSDDIEGRTKAFQAIIKGDPIPEPAIPESFKVLVKELAGLSLDVSPYKAKYAKEVIELEEDVKKTKKNDVSKLETLNINEPEEKTSSDKENK